MSSIVSADALRVISEVVDNPASAPVERVARPFWQTAPCPPWCTEVHTGASFYEDRNHAAAPGQPMDLSLYRVQLDANTAVPATIDASIRQHYRETEPTISLSVPKHGDEPHTAAGEADVEMTPAEVRALRDRLTLILRLVDGEQLPLDVQLGKCLDGATRRSIENTVRLGDPFGPEVAVTANMLQWTEGDASPLLEVEVTVADNADGCTPTQARRVAAQLRQAADLIARLADEAERANAVHGGAR